MAYAPQNPNGQAAKTASAPVVIASDDDIQAKLGIVTETAPASDTASSGLNGRLQRIAQRLTSLIAQIPAALGQTTKTASLSVTIASDDDSLVSLQLLDDTIIADNAGFTDGTTKISMAGFILDETAGTALTENDAAAARIDSKRAMIGVIEDETTRGQRATVNASKGLAVSVIPHTAGGLSTYHLMSAATTNATVVKASAGQLYGWYIYNSNAAARKLVFHNASSTPTAGASVFFSIMIPAASGANVFSEIGIAFSTGIAITTVTDAADNGTTAVALNDLNINLFYK